MAWRRNEPCGWASGRCQGSVLAMARAASSIEQIRDRLKSRYPEAEPLPNRPELDDLLRKVGFDVRWEPETSTYHRREASILVTSGSSTPEASDDSDLHQQGGDHPGDGGGPTVRGAADATPTAMAGSWCSPSGPAGCGGARTNFCGGSGWSGSRSTTCSSTPCARRPRHWKSTGPSSSRPTGRTLPARTGTT